MSIPIPEEQVEHWKKEAQQKAEVYCATVGDLGMNPPNFYKEYGKNLAIIAYTAGLNPEYIWMPIDTAPKDNKLPLIIAHFNHKGEMTSMDWNASYEQEQESWEVPQLYWTWCSANGSVDEPTHWMYQPDWFAKISVPKKK